MLRAALTPLMGHVRVRLGRVAWAARQFRAQRADYYEYLADVMAQGDGRRTLRTIFDDDARRYGRRRARGVLSAHWSHQFQQCGGDLLRTFSGTLPAEDLVPMAVAQRAGAGALEAALRDLAGATRLADQARAVFTGTVAAGVVALAVAVGAVLAMPFFTVPRLKQVFIAVPEDFWGATARRLFWLSDAVAAHALPVALSVAALAGVLGWSLAHLTGAWRARLDDWFIWRLYRDFQGMRFLALLAVTVRQRGHVDTRLRDALAVQLPGASAWKAWHLDRMIARIDRGHVGASTFETGLLDDDTRWFLADMIDARGMDTALQLARARVEHRTLRIVAARAALLRWTLLLGAVGVLVTLALWHVATIDELRRAMSQFYAR